MRLLVSILGQPALDPEETSKAYAKDQELFQKVAHSDEYKYTMLYTPRPWFNAEQKRAHADDDPDDVDRVFEGGHGALLVNFPRLNGDRWQSMAGYLHKVEQSPNPYSIPLHDTAYVANTTHFWARIHGARALISQADELLKPVEEWPQKYPGMDYAKTKVEDMLAAEAEQADVLTEAVKGLQAEYDRVRDEEMKNRGEYDEWRKQMTERERELTKEMEGDLKKEKERDREQRKKLKA